MNTETKVDPIADPRRKQDDTMPRPENGVDSALDEGLEESFPASDPVAVTIAKLPKKPVEKT